MKNKRLKSRKLLLVCASTLLMYGLWASSCVAQSLWPFGNNQEQDKEQSQRQAPVERAFSENYWKLTEKQRALASDKYDEYVKQQKDQPPKDGPPQSEPKRTIKSLNAPDNPFQ